MIEEALDEDADFDDDLDEYDDDLEDDDDDDDERTGIATVERLSSVDTWEMYRVVDQDTGLLIASVAISAPRVGAKSVDYAVWRRKNHEEPGATGSVLRAADDGATARTWDDGERESVIRDVLRLHEGDLGVEPDKAEFLLAPPEDGGDEEELEEED